MIQNFSHHLHSVSTLPGETWAA